ncbi:MAG: helix-turn-helix transcriptional regulator [Clostridia bacterium]|nr:helix-turn-helix transcriptional regulator [Clostridia bacterium]
MSIEFSAKLSLLRKEKNISQRQASEELGVSQALLSHYEKGIRECSLDFVRKAALYYGVSSDYLLGLTENRKRITDLYSPDDTSEDRELSQKTMIRAIIYLSETAAVNGDSALDFFCDYFSLYIKKYAALLSNEPQNVITLCDLSAQTLVNEKRTDRKRTQDLSDPPEAFNTVKAHSEDVIKSALESLL